MQISDQYICDLIRNRKKKGIEELYHKYYKLLVVWADTFLNDLSVAEDLVQEFFIAIWEKRYLENIHFANLKTYLYISVRHRVLNQLDRKDPLREVCGMEKIYPLWEEYDSGLDHIIVRVHKAVESLPPRSREVVECVYLNNMKYKDVAEKLHVSVATVKTLLVNSLKSLRKTLNSNLEFLFFFLLRKKN